MSTLVDFSHDETPAAEPLRHKRDYDTVSVILQQPVGRAVLERFLDELPAGVMRVKGIVQLVDSPDRRTIVHRVATRRTIATEGPWRDGESGRLVVIGLADVPLEAAVQLLFS
jgi:G3E family GTPase